ncbi:MAG: DUF4062 domain-containing protein, partial [Pseudomonadota bacterium]
MVDNTRGTPLWHPKLGPEARSFRVFLSSTFRDMDAERDHLVQVVFPQLRQLAWKRSVAFQEVDLRWGITVEEAQRGEIIDRCLNEIDLCHPFFVAMIGSRYGYADPTPADELPAHLAPFAGRSVTEMEIRHAVARCAGSGHAPGLAYVQRGVEHSDDLRRLVHDLPKLGFTCRDYTGPQDLGTQLYQDLAHTLDTFWPEDAPVPAVSAQSHLARLQHGAIHRKPLERRLRRALRWHRRILLNGPAGSGMSTALAQLARDPPGGRAVTYASADLMVQGGTWRDLQAQISDQDKETADFGRTVAEVSGRGGGIIVMDALDRLWDGLGEPDLSWLDVEPRRGTTVVIAVSRQEAAHALQETGWHVVPVPPMTRGERALTAETYLDNYGKRLAHADSARLVAAPAAQNPATLKLMLSDLRVLSDYSQLGTSIDQLGEVTGPDALAEALLLRLRDQLRGPELQALDRGLPALVLARAGLAEADLLDILGYGAQPMPYAYWRPVASAVSDHLGYRDGRLEVVSDAMRRAILSQLVPHDEVRVQMRLELAEQAARALDPGRARFEIPLQTALAGRLDMLDQFLSDPDHQAQLLHEAPAELQRFAGLLSASPDGKTLAQAKRAARGDDPSALRVAAEMLTFLGHPQAAEEALTRLGETATAPKGARLQACLGAAELARQRGATNQASQLLERAKDFAEAPKDVATIDLRMVGFQVGQGAIEAALQRLATVQRTTLTPRLQCEASRLDAIVTLAHNDLRSAETHARTARKTALQCADPAEAAAAALTLAQVA